MYNNIPNGAHSTALGTFDATDPAVVLNIQVDLTPRSKYVYDVVWTQIWPFPLCEYLETRCLRRSLARRVREGHTKNILSTFCTKIPLSTSAISLRTIPLPQ